MCFMYISVLSMCVWVGVKSSCDIFATNLLVDCLFMQGKLTEGKGSVRLTSLHLLVWISFFKILLTFCKKFPLWGGQLYWAFAFSKGSLAHACTHTLVRACASMHCMSWVSAWAKRWISSDVTQVFHWVYNCATFNIKALPGVNVIKLFSFITDDKA